MEFLVLAVFTGMLIGCVAFGIPVLYALVGGLLLFFAYSLKKGFSLKETIDMCLQGIKTVKNVLLTMILIGVLTGLWRSAGTIPTIVVYCVRLITPSIFILLAFLLNCLVSFLIGTSFGTAATMGAICMAIAQTMGVSPVMAGGAIISGAFFGDRCSPVSTSTLLVSEVTRSDMYENIREMMKTAVIPFGICCILFWGMGWLQNSSGGTAADVGSLFAKEFKQGIIPLLPAVIILILALRKVEVKKAMIVSILWAFVICLFYQQRAFSDVFHTMVLGYSSADPQIGKMMDGGGILSMVKVVAIVCLSSCFSGIFETTGLLKPLQEKIAKAGEKISPFGVILPVSALACAVSCNQTLAIIVTQQLCHKLVQDKKDMAMYLENGAVLIAPLFPWSIAGAVPLAAIGAPDAALLAGCYLYLVPLCQLVTDTFTYKSKRRKK